MIQFEQWEGFEGRIWKEEVNVRDFIQKNYTPYDGDESFLAGPTEATDKLWGALQQLQKAERAKGGVQDIETDNFIVVSVYCDPCISLFFEKSISCFFCQVFFLWECYTILYHLIPYCNSCCYVFCLIFSDYNIHSSVLHFPYHTVNDQFSVSLHTSAYCF
mgnify:CR=1 FL=1